MHPKLSFVLEDALDAAERGEKTLVFCSRVETTLSQLRLRYGDDVRIVWKNNPLSFHSHAQLAAEAASLLQRARGHR